MVVVHYGYIVGVVVAIVMVMVVVRWVAWVAEMGMVRWHVRWWGAQ